MEAVINALVAWSDWILSYFDQFISVAAALLACALMLGLALLVFSVFLAFAWLQFEKTKDKLKELRGGGSGDA